jgi:phosphatidylglycerol:prolipoprotein diacylglycerol transferase
MGTHIIGFPGLGINSFEIDSVAFAIPFFGKDIAWYGILVTLGILGGILYAFWRGTKYNGITLDDMFDIALFAVPSAVIGARAYYIIFNLERYKTFYSVIATWEGGLAVYGGIIFGFLAAFLVCKHKKISIPKVFDSAAPAFMLGQIIGRWGNFTNGEAFGGATELSWRMYIYGPNSNFNGIEVHPTFLYESLWNLAGFIIINLLYKKRRFPGQIFLMYITWYGFGRMLIEGMRADSLYFGKVRISQAVGLLCFIAGTVLLAVNMKKTAAANGEYENVYNFDSLSKSDENESENKNKNESAEENK